MKLCLTILSVPWYMFNGLEHTAILSNCLTFITGSSPRLLRIRFSADLTMYWFPVCHFRCKELNPLVISLSVSVSVSGTLYLYLLLYNFIILGFS
jgi:hypothetical protein